MKDSQIEAAIDKLVASNAVNEAKKPVPVEKAVEILQAKFPDIQGIKPGEEWSPDHKDSIFLGDAAEGGTIDEWPAYDAYVEDYEEKYYIMGVHKELDKALKELGYFAEPYDSGTLFAWPM